MKLALNLETKYNTNNLIKLGLYFKLKLPKMIFFSNQTMVHIEIVEGVLEKQKKEWTSCGC